MASLTPGVLLKLLQSMNSDVDGKIVGEHRSAILQVIGIVPALSASTVDPLRPDRGFLLNLSDSLHSTYVSLSDRDADAVLSSRPQLGQLVLVDRLLFSHPLPRAVGLRSLPGLAKHHPSFIGSPEPLIARSSQNQSGFTIVPAGPAENSPPLMPSSSERRAVFAAKENVPDAAAPETNPKRRFSSPAVRKLPVKEGTGATGPTKAAPAPSRPASPALSRNGSRHASPVPSKCVVPSLIVAKEDNRRPAREPAIVVPSRYRQPSPAAAGRKSSSGSSVRRASISPMGRRLSSGLKLSMAPSPMATGGEVGIAGKKKGVVLMTGISKQGGLTVRKSCDDSSAGESGLTSETKEKNKGRRLGTQVPMRLRLSDVGAEASDDEDGTSVNSKMKPRKSKVVERSSTSGKTKQSSRKIEIHDRRWTDGSIRFSSVSGELAKLGEDAIGRREAASMAATQALLEAMVAESIVRNLSKFSDLKAKAEAGDPVPVIDSFISIFDGVLEWEKVAEDASCFEKPASLWVEAALATDLEVVRLLNSSGKSKSGGDKLLQQASMLPQKKKTSGSSATVAMKNTAEFARALRREMQVWFVGFVEAALDVGFLEFREKASMEATAMLSHFKRISDWMEKVGKLPSEDVKTREKVDKAKRKIYGFVISHMEAAFH